MCDRLECRFDFVEIDPENEGIDENPVLEESDEELFAPQKSRCVLLSGFEQAQVKPQGNKKLFIFLIHLDN